MGASPGFAPAMNRPLLFFAYFHLPSTSSFAFSSSDTFPSCLREGFTWDISGAYKTVLNLPTPELCQQLCAKDHSCVASTWMSASAPVLPLTCSLFSEVSADQVVPCEECVSGPPECPCTVNGECNILEENIINIVTNVESVEECSRHCSENSLCEVFTYLGEENHFSQVVQMGSIPVLLLDPTFMVLYQKNGTMFIATQVDPCGIASVKSLHDFNTLM